MCKVIAFELTNNPLNWHSAFYGFKLIEFSVKLVIAVIRIACNLFLNLCVNDLRYLDWFAQALDLNFHHYQAIFKGINFDVVAFVLQDMPRFLDGLFVLWVVVVKVLFSAALPCFTVYAVGKAFLFDAKEKFPNAVVLPAVSQPVLVVLLYLDCLVVIKPRTCF